MSIIVFDTETTGLLAPMAAGQEHQPHLVELYAIKLNNSLVPVDALTFRCKPPIQMPLDAMKVHGISDNDVADCLPFAYWLNDLTKFFLGGQVLIGHNLMFDKMVVWWELVRLGKVLNFPWAPGAIDTAEICTQQYGHRLNLNDLHAKLFGVDSFSNAHSANADCSITVKCFIEMARREMVVL